MKLFHQEFGLQTHDQTQFENTLKGCVCQSYNQSRSGCSHETAGFSL